jgi:CubicO group peptidase (beta-lactamase class C family)
MRLWLFSVLALATGLASARADRVDDYLASEMASHRIPGACLLVVQTNATVKRASYGLANVELKVPVTAETVFEIGSLTKQFTAACVLLLAQDGKLSIDDKIEQHLRHIPESWHDITIRQLLNHTSGIKSYTGLDGFELRRHLTQDQFIAALAGYPLEFEPGHSFKYCNSGYSLLGYIIENVSGKSYWDFLGERILHPLGMATTTNRAPAQILPNRASGYEQTNQVWINRDYDLTDVFSAGAIASTIGDLAKWNASLDAGTLLTAGTQREMWRPARLKDGTETKYGFGWRIEEFEGHRNIGHGGATSGFSASLQRFPDDHVAVILLTNTDEQIATLLARNVARFYFK